MNRSLLANLKELAALGERTNTKPYDRIHDLLRKRCAMILEAHPVTETDWRRQHARGVWGAVLTSARTAQGRVLDLAICHHIDHNSAYRDRAIEELTNLAGWSEWLGTANKREMAADLCTAECCTTMALGLDWLSDDMTDSQRTKCTQALLEKGLKPYLKAVDDQVWWYDCYHNWNAVINSGVGMAALALSDTSDEAKQALKLCRSGLKHFFDALGSEGGWDEGAGYWGYAMRYLMLFARATERLTGDKSMLHQRGMTATCDFGLFFTPMGHSMSFGDSPAAPFYGALYAAADSLASREICWWLDRWAYHRDVDVSGWSDAGLGLLLRPVSMEYLPSISPPPVKVYHEIGWAALADHWCEPGIYASVKTGDLSAHHSHLDMNSVQIQLNGENLICNMANPPGTHSFNFTSDNNDDIYEVDTQAHNTLTVADRSHRIDARGEIIESHCGGNHRWVTASAGDALGENVHFIRHVVMALGPNGSGASHLAVIDELRNVRAEKAAVLWHSYGEIISRGNRGLFSGRRGSLHYHLASNRKIKSSLLSHKVGRLTESALKIDIPACNEVILVSMFSREPVSEITLQQTDKRAVSILADKLEIEFSDGPGHMVLARVVRHKKNP